MIPSALTGKRIANTRARRQAEELDRLLSQTGAVPIAYPCLEMAPPDDSAPLDAALRQLAAGHFDWLVLTSSNTVSALQARLKHLRLSATDLRPGQVAAVGPATAAAAFQGLGLRASLIPDQYVAEALAETIISSGRGRVFLPQSDLARPVLTTTLTHAGLDVTTVAAYRTVPGAGGAPLPEMLRTQQVHAITFTSPSTVHNFRQRLLAEGGDLAWLQDVCLACIGPVTAAALVDLGLIPQVTPTRYTLAGLVSGLETFFSEAHKS